MYLGIDLGTSSVKIMITDDRGNCVYSAGKNYPLFTDKLMSEQNPRDWTEAVFTLIKDTDATLRKKLRAVGLAGQMHGLVVVDRNGNVLRPAILWNDQRAFKEAAYLNNEVGIDKVHCFTGNIALTGFTAPKLLWLKNNEPDIFNKIHKILLPKDYINYCLTGAFVTDYSDASGTLYFNVQKKKWSEDMLRILGISKTQLPELGGSCELAGYVLPEAATELGLPEGVKVYRGGGDQAIGALGSLALYGGEAIISLGTSGVIFVNTPKYISDKSKSLHVFVNALGGYHYMGVMLACAQSLSWWSQILNMSIEDMLKQISADETDVIFLPYLQGERTPLNDPFIRASFTGLSSATTTDELTLAVLEGAALALKDILETIKLSGIHIKKAAIIGGGAKSERWIRIIADCLGIVLETGDTKDTVAFGAALTALAGENGTEILYEMKKNQKAPRIFLPNANKSVYYESKYKKFKAVYKNLK